MATAGQLMATHTHDRLDPSEQHFRIPGHPAGLSLFLRYMPPTVPPIGSGKNVLYVHGGTFASALSIAHRFDGRSWRDELCAAGFHVWGLDFHGFGALSDPFPQLAEPADKNPPLGRAPDASRQLEHAVRFICSHQQVQQLSIIAHSWGTMVTGLLAGRRPELIDRLVFFAPIVMRPADKPAQQLGGWRLISLDDQWQRFTADVPRGERPVLLRRHFDDWGQRYLDVDPDSRTRAPPAVKTPSGAFQDIFDAWAGTDIYDPGRIRAPVAIIRGEWDSYCTDDDGQRLFARLTASSIRRDIKVSRGTHLMHLEESRYALYREAETFLAGHDGPSQVLAAD